MLKTAVVMTTSGLLLSTIAQNKCHTGSRACHALITSILLTSPSPMVWKSVRIADTLGIIKLLGCLDWKTNDIKDTF